MSAQIFPWLVAVAVMLVIAAAGLLLGLLFGGGRNTRMSGRLYPGATDPQQASVPQDTSVFTQGFQRLAASGRGMERWFKDEEEGMDRLLVRAGWRGGQARSIFYIGQAALPVAGVGLVLLIWLSLGKGLRIELFLYAFMAFAIGVLLPRYLLRQAVAERLARIRAEVSVLINLLVLLFEAGLSTRQALHSLVRDGEGVLPELAGEFRLALRQIEAGGETGEVLQSMGQTLDVNELASVLGVLRQIERYGGEVREPLLSALAVIEERRGLTLRERVNLLSGRMTVVMVLFFFPALMFCVAGPAFTSIFKALKSVSS